MIGCLRTRVPKQPIIVLYFESETVLKFYNLETWSQKLQFAFLFILYYYLVAQLVEL